MLHSRYGSLRSSWLLKYISTQQLDEENQLTTEQHGDDKMLIKFFLVKNFIFSLSELIPLCCWLRGSGLRVLSSSDCLLLVLDILHIYSVVKHCIT